MKGPNIRTVVIFVVFSLLAFTEYSIYNLGRIDGYYKAKDESAKDVDACVDETQPDLYVIPYQISLCYHLKSIDRVLKKK